MSVNVDSIGPLVIGKIIRTFGSEQVRVTNFESTNNANERNLFAV